MKLIEAPNRYRKLMKEHSEYPNGKKYSDIRTEQSEIIEMQRKEFPDMAGEPIGLHLGLDMKEYIEWE